MAATNIGVRPTQAVTEDFGGIIQQGVDDLIAGKEKARQRAKEEQDRIAEFQDKYMLNEEDLFLDPTEFRSVNDISIEAVSQYRDRYYEVYKQLQADPTNIMLKKRLGSIRAGIGQLKSSHEKLKGLGEKYVEMLENDQVSGVQAEKIEKLLESYDVGMGKIKLNDKDIIELLSYDKDGTLMDVKNYRDLINFDIIKKNDVEAELDTMAKRLGGEKITTPTADGKWLSVRNIFGDKQKMAASREIDAYVNNDATMADLYQQLVDKDSRRESGFTEEEKRDVKARLLERLEGRYGEQVDLRPNPYGVAATQAAYARQAAKDKQDAEKPSVIVNTEQGAPQVDDDGSIVYSLDKPSALDATKDGLVVTGIKKGSRGEITLTGQKRQKVRKNPDELGADKIAELQADPAAMFYQDKDTGIVTYYEVRDDVVTWDPNSKSANNRAALSKINAWASRNKFGDETGLQQALDSALTNKFPGMSEDLQRRNAAMEAAQQTLRKQRTEEEEVPATEGEAPQPQDSAPAKKFG